MLAKEVLPQFHFASIDAKVMTAEKANRPARWPCSKDQGMGETTIRFSTSVTPGAAQTVSSAACFSI